MTTLAALAQMFASQERPAGNLLDEDGVVAQAVAATRFYAGYAWLRAQQQTVPVPMPMPDPGRLGAGHLPCGGGAASSLRPDTQITGETDISGSEWAIIRPLFLLYVERETALQLEASRGLGIDPYGRSVSEIATEITQAEADLPHRAFSVPIITV